MKKIGLLLTLSFVFIFTVYSENIKAKIEGPEGSYNSDENY